MNIQNRKVLVIMTAYNAEKTILMAIRSVLTQEFLGEILLVIVDDCSTDRTRKILREFKRDDVVIIENETNIGTYNSINKVLLSNYEWNYFIKCDADDYITPDRIEKQVSAIEKYRNKYYSSVCQYTRQDFLTGERITAPKLGDSMLCITFETFLKIGLFDCVRFGADSDYLQRVKKYLGDDKLIRIKEVLYLAYNFGNNLTQTHNTDEVFQYAEKIKQKYYG